MLIMLQYQTSWCSVVFVLLYIDIWLHRPNLILINPGQFLAEEVRFLLIFLLLSWLPKHVNTHKLPHIKYAETIHIYPHCTDHITYPSLQFLCFNWTHVISEPSSLVNYMTY